MIYNLMSKSGRYYVLIALVIIAACIICVINDHGEVVSDQKNNLRMDKMTLEQAMGVKLPGSLRILRKEDNDAAFCGDGIHPFVVYQLSVSIEDIDVLIKAGKLLSNKSSLLITDSDKEGLRYMLRLPRPLLGNTGALYDVEDWYNRPSVAVYYFTMNKLFIDKETEPWGLYFSLGPDFLHKKR